MRIYEQRKSGSAAARAFAGRVPAHLNPPVGDIAWMTCTSLSTPGSEEMTL